MENTPFFIICTVIVLFSSTLSAIATIYGFAKKPAAAYREKQDAEIREKIISTLEEVLPKLLNEHDLEIREKYKADRERYLQDITNCVTENINDKLVAVEVLGSSVETLMCTAKDVLREKIVDIYMNNKESKALTVITRERLTQYYKDYKALKGNSYIDKYYNRMAKWETIDDDYVDDDVI